MRCKTIDPRTPCMCGAGNLTGGRFNFAGKIAGATQKARYGRSGEAGTGTLPTPKA